MDSGYSGWSQDIMGGVRVEWVESRWSEGVRIMEYFSIKLKTKMINLMYKLATWRALNDKYIIFLRQLSTCCLNWSFQ